jgi:hypothetical protein
MQLITAEPLRRTVRLTGAAQHRPAVEAARA